MRSSRKELENIMIPGEYAALRLMSLGERLSNPDSMTFGKRSDKDKIEPY